MNKLMKDMLIVILLASMPLLCGAAINSITYTATYGSSDMTLGTDTLGGVTYTTVTYGDLTNGGQPGAPSLPIDYLRFSVPAYSTNFTVSVSTSSNMVRTINHLVYPNQMPRRMDDTTEWVITQPDNTIYNSGNAYPTASGMAWIADEGFLAGENHIVTVAVMPISFTNVKFGMRRKELLLSRMVTVTLHYELSDSLPMYPIVRNDTALRNEGYRLAQSMVVNPDNVEGNAPWDLFPIDSMAINPGIGGDGLNGLGDVTPWNPMDSLEILPSNQMASYPYLIVTTEALKNSVKRLVALKQLKGYRVKVVTMDQVLSSPFAGTGDTIIRPDGIHQVVFTDDAGKLRHYLKYFFKYFGTEFVLLVGTDVPYRIQWGYPTDLYYSDLSNNWDNNYDTTVEKLPELYVGRILAKSNQQIENYTDKLFRYELNPGLGDYEYLKRIFYSEALDFEIKDEWNYVNDSYTKTYPNYTRFLEQKDTVFPTGTDIINELNHTRYGYVSFLNHGCPSGFVTYGQRDDKNGGSIDPKYYLWAIDSIRTTYDNTNYIGDTCTGNGLNNLTNKYYPSICYSSGCELMPFDFRAHFPVETNFGESFTTGKDYGGPAFLGNTRSGWLGRKSTGLEKLFAEQLSDGYYKVGAAEALSKCYYEDNIMPMIHNLLGDPEFEIWTDLPQQFSGIEVTRTGNSVIVSGIATDSVTVVYRNHNEVKSQTAIGTTSVTFNNVSPDGVIMLYKHNWIPYISSMVLQNVSLNKSHYAITSDVVAGGNVIVRDGTEYEIEASGTVTLEDGFKVERGATFAVYPASF